MRWAMAQVPPRLIAPPVSVEAPMLLEFPMRPGVSQLRHAVIRVTALASTETLRMWPIRSPVSGS